MTLTDKQFLGVVTPHAGRPLVSVLLVGDGESAERALARVPAIAEEVILVDACMPLRAGFTAARGKCIVMMDAAAEAGASDVVRFIDALWAGSASARATASAEA